MGAISRKRHRHVRSHASTFLGKAVTEIDRKGDRLIVFTDEQSHDQVPAPKGRGYMVNVASHHHGVGHGAWTRASPRP
jgi:60 kDa SS-A/Ro ribonucleoprotein